MKTLKFFVFMLFVIMLQSQNSFSFGIAIGNPCIQAAFPTPYFYPNGTVSVDFRIDSLTIIDSKYALCMIYVVQRNVEVMMYREVIEQGHNLSIPINPMNFPNLAYNEPVKIKIEAVSARPPHLSSFNYAYAILYKPGLSVTYGSISNGTPQQINSGFATFYRSLDCHTLATGNYYVNQYKITFTLNGNFHDSIPEVDAAYCYGYDGSLPNYQHRWGYKVSQTSTQATFNAFVYFVTNTLGQQLGYWPCPPPQATIVYHYVKKPVIGSIYQLISPITPINHIGLFYSSLLNGSRPLHYEWIDSFNIHNHQIIRLNDTIPYVLLNANFSNMNVRVPPYTIYSRACNDAGCSEWKKCRVQFSSDPPHGCPQIEIPKFGNNFFLNAILNRSPGNPGIEVTDHFLFQSGFFEENDSIIFSIKESDDAITKINLVDMYQALVPKGTEFGVTDDGEKVSYLITPDKNLVTLNFKIDKTEELSLTDNEVVGLNIGDELKITFREDNENQYIAFRMKTNEKTLPAAMITSSNDNEPKEVYSRTNISSTILKLKPEKLNWVNFTANQKCEIDMISVFKNESSHELKKLSCISAVNNRGNVSKLIFAEDKHYVTVEKDNPLELIFQNNLRSEKDAYYFANILGSYTSDSRGDNKNSMNNEEDKLEFKLFDNTPNPFNPITKINFQIPEKSFVKLSVYDISGREIKVLVNEFKNKGSYEFTFDGSNFASGVYFYKLEFGNFTDTKRMLLIK